MRANSRVAAVLLALIAIILGTVSAAQAQAPPHAPTAHSSNGMATVGPLFENGLQSGHSCTASVLDSPTGNLIMTAAHCLHGTGAGIQFVPGYDRGRAPHGVWTVTHVYLDPHWVAERSPRYDFAIAQVASPGGRTVQSVTGGDVLSLAPRTGQRILDVAYNAGSGDQPVQCRTNAYYRKAFPAFNCHGFVGGSSGSPWLTPVTGAITLVSGVIGGLHQGGCQEYTSYSSPFTVAVLFLQARAVAGDEPDTAPAAGSDGC